MKRRPAVQKQLGEAIRQFREAKKWSQEKLAEQADVHRNYVGSAERGERNVSLVNIVKLAKALGMTGSDLLKAASL